MKKERGFVLALSLVVFALLICINYASAVDINIKKSAYYSGETLQAEIAGNFVNNLNVENIGIYFGNNVHKTPVEQGMIKYNNKYRYYAVLPMQAGTYSLRIENEKHIEGGVQTENAVEKNFTISQTNNSYLSISPGYIYASGNFEIIVRAYNNYQDVNIDFSPTKFKKSFNIGYDETKFVDIDVGSIKEITEASIKVNSYDIPVIISPKINNTIINTNESGSNVDLTEDIALDTREINGSVMKNVPYNFNFLIVNKEQQYMEINVTTSSDVIKVNHASFGFDYEQIINVTIKISSEINEKITLASGRSKLDIPVKLKVVNNISQVNISTPSTNTQKTCSQEGGSLCDAFSGKNTCEGISKYAADGECCIGICSKPSSSKAWIWGIVIIIVLGVGVYFIYQKYKKDSGSAEKISRILKKKTEDYEKRMNPEPKEVSKSLARE